MPGVAVVAESVFEIRRSEVRPMVSVSLAELLADVGSVTPLGTLTVAVFTNEPVALAEMFAVRV